MADFSKYENIKVGDKAFLVKKITNEDVQKFVSMTGDDNPLHVNHAYAESTEFKGIVVHGMLGASFISTIIGKQLPGEGALWISQSFDFLLPVRLGDELTVEGTVIKKYDKEHIIELSTVIKNQNKATVLSGTGKVKILEVKKPIEVVKTNKPKLAIVTGATGGIGAEICRALAKDGFNIALFYRSQPEKAQALANELSELKVQTLLCKVDLSNETEIRSAIQNVCASFGGIGVLVNNASPKIQPCKFEDLTWSNFSEHFDVQLKASLLLMQLCAEKMKQTGGGSIINISSQVIDGSPSPSWTAYASAKSALSTLSKYAASELGPYGIRVNQVAPGMTETNFIGDVPEKARLIAARQAPLRKLATPLDVANTVAFLASDKSDHLTGETIRVNGGMVML